MRVAARQRLEFAERRYLKTANPVYAWEAFLDARQAHVEIPTAVLQYLDRCALRIAQITRKQRAFRPKLTPEMTEQEVNEALTAPDPVSIEDVARAVAMAMEFIDGRNGPINKLRTHLDLSHEMGIAASVYFRMRQGEQKKYAIEHAAAEHPDQCGQVPPCRKIDPRTVRRYWDKHASSFPPIPPQDK